MGAERELLEPLATPLAVPRPEPRRAVVVVDAPEPAPHYWAGAPSAAVDGGVVYLAYRLRRPRSAGRGGQLVIARSADGERFETIATITKEQLGTESIERAALVAVPDGRWRLYLSYVDPADGRWRIDVLTSERPDGFDPGLREPALRAGDVDGEAVKDPVVHLAGGRWHLWASYLPRPESPVAGLHAGHDAYLVGAVPSATGYATSDDGVRWTWHGPALTGAAGEWDGYCARITSVLLDGGRPVAYYDGGRTVADNYEERTGLALGDGLADFQRRPGGPAAVSPHATGSLRYLCVLPVDSGYRLYYECAMPNGSHALLTEFTPRP